MLNYLYWNIIWFYKVLTRKYKTQYDIHILVSFNPNVYIIIPTNAYMFLLSFLNFNNVKYGILLGLE